MNLVNAIPTVLLITTLSATASSFAAEVRDRNDVDSLAATIDQLIEKRWSEKNVKPARDADDAQFLRRVYLDISGKIPSVSQVRIYLEDPAEDKRRKVVEHLLSGPGYITNFSSKLRRVLLPEAAADAQVRFLIPTFEAWLREQMRDDTSYDEIAREILTLPLGSQRNRNGGIDGSGNQLTPLAFYQAKQVAPENLAAATSRIFMGIRIECAQCHDHPFDHWRRDQFWSLAAFYAGMQRANPDQGFFGRVTEVFDRREIAIPETDQVVQAAFLNGVEPQWRFRESARVTLAHWMTSVENPYFARTAVNRLWEHFFGIGLVDPVDDFGSHHPPSHPELLDRLAKEFAAHDFEFKFLIRAITASRTYGRSSEKTDERQSDPRLFGRMAIKGLSPEQLYDSIALAIGHHEPFNAQRGLAVNDARSEFLELFNRETESLSETQTTILQALAMMNGQIVAGATDLEQSKTLASILNFPLMDTSERIETLFLATVSRPPRKSEMERLLAYVERTGSHAERHAALSDVFWALLNSSEFVFNH